mmetsp:Transcript_5604/g.17937  ORF Transcript_5604/g.17937 Transcript_5604/m.17937 type:complete len:92 (-) Transcript_5604:1611-1886(-)
MSSYLSGPEWHKSRNDVTLSTGAANRPVQAAQTEPPDPPLHTNCARSPRALKRQNVEAGFTTVPVTASHLEYSIVAPSNCLSKVLIDFVSR